MGLQLSTQKTNVLTTQAQPPSQLQTPNGLIISVLDRESRHKWLGCMLMTYQPQHAMLSVDCRPRQELSMQTGGSFVTRKFRLLRNSNILIVSYPPKRVLQQDTEPFTAVIYAVWMLHIVGFSDQWWGLLAIWMGHYHGTKFSTSGMRAFGPSPRRLDPNHGRKFAGHRWIKRV